MTKGHIITITKQRNCTEILQFIMFSWMSVLQAFTQKNKSYHWSQSRSSSHTSLKTGLTGLWFCLRKFHHFYCEKTHILSWNCIVNNTCLQALKGNQVFEKKGLKPCFKTAYVPTRNYIIYFSYSHHSVEQYVCRSDYLLQNVSDG